MKRISLILVVLLTLTLALTGCGGSAKSTADAMSAPAASSAPSYDYAPEASAPAEKEMPQSSATSDVNSSLYNDPDNKVIRTARMTIQTTEFDQAVAALAQLTEKLGGYYETAQVDGGGYYNQYANRSAYYVVRIPKENFTAFRNGTGGIGYVYSSSEDAQNVGEEYYDTEARLETLTTKRDRLLALLEKAEIMEDIISLEDALADVQYEIDMHTSTLRKYDSLIDFSTFTIYLEEVTKIVEEPKAEDSFGVKLMANLRDGLERFGEGLQDFALWAARNLIGIIIFAAIVAVVLVVVHKKVHQRRRADEPKSE